MAGVSRTYSIMPKHKCSKCKRAAVIIENKIYFCADCYLKLKKIFTS